MKAIQRVPIVQQVADGIKELITDTIQGGDKCHEKALSEMMGVGAAPSREAFR
jgi:DNA-binding GntR family transcriptional regulator